MPGFFFGRFFSPRPIPLQGLSRWKASWMCVCAEELPKDPIPPVELAIQGIVPPLKVALRMVRGSNSGFPDTTQDADLYVEKTTENCRALVAALREIGFALTDDQAAEILCGKDFVQLKNGPFDLDLVFAPDGIERFGDAWKRRVEVEGFPVCHIDDIIASKAASNR